MDDVERINAALADFAMRVHDDAARLYMMRASLVSLERNLLRERWGWWWRFGLSDRRLRRERDRLLALADGHARLADRGRRERHRASCDRGRVGPVSDETEAT